MLTLCWWRQNEIALVLLLEYLKNRDRQVQADLTLAAVVLICVIVMVAGCGANAEGSQQTSGDHSPRDSKILSATETKHLLRDLPYKYSFRSVPLPKGAIGAVAGKVRGSHQTTFQFGVALGRSPYPVPVPQAGIANAVGIPSAGFVFTTNLSVRGPKGNWIEGPEIHTAAQSSESSRMEVAMEEALCRAATGKPCPV